MIGMKAPRALDLPVGTRWMRSFDRLTSGLVLGYESGEEVANAGSEAPDSEAPEMNANAVVWCAEVLLGPPHRTRFPRAVQQKCGGVHRGTGPVSD
jgi:hypothetical protein